MSLLLKLCYVFSLNYSKVLNSILSLTTIFPYRVGKNFNNFFIVNGASKIYLLIMFTIFHPNIQIGVTQGIRKLKLQFLLTEGLLIG